MVWESKKKQIIELSTTKAEYIVLAYAPQDSQKRMMVQEDIFPSSPPRTRLVR